MSVPEEDYYTKFDIYVFITAINSYKPSTNTAWVRTRLCKLQTRVGLDSQPQVIKFTSCLPVVGGSHRVLRLLPPLKLVAII
jgi:hypothetical protein